MSDDDSLLMTAIVKGRGFPEASDVCFTSDQTGERGMPVKRDEYQRAYPLSEANELSFHFLVATPAAQSISRA